jgi:hypothetical protein
MDWSAVIGIAAIIVTIFNGVVGYWVKQVSKSQDILTADHKAIAKDLRDLEIRVSDEYVKKSDINLRLDRIDMILDKIMDKLDTKADK